jgi:oxalate decarboxylase/phosphoglucose isomerase-like protein (cupin superfamily)
MTENASKSTPPKSAYDLWQEAEGVPIHRGYYVEDLYTVEVGPWARFGASGALVNLALQTEDDAWVLEVRPGGQTNPVHHLFECQTYVLSGRGSARVWVEGQEPRTFEFGKGSLFALPLNASYQYFNASGREPVRMFAVTSAPKMINLIRNPDFLFDNPYVFADRFDGRLDYFSDPGREIGKRTWKTNFVPDVRTFQLSDYSERGKGSTNVKFSLAGSAMAAHISEFKVGTYKMAHRHGAGAHVVILDGQGFSLMWEEGSEWMKVDWKDGSVLSPPDNWYHQHFNTGPTPARYLALRWNSPEYPSRSYWQPQYSENLGEQISLEDEDPRIRAMWEADLARNGVQSRMEPVLSRAG